MPVTIDIYAGHVTSSKGFQPHHVVLFYLRRLASATSASSQQCTVKDNEHATGSNFRKGTDTALHIGWMVIYEIFFRQNCVVGVLLLGISVTKIIFTLRNFWCSNLADFLAFSLVLSAILQAQIFR